jgi:hypothetical protein
MENKQNGNCTGWKAWYNRMPGSEPTLHVVGACEFPTDGYTVELKPANPQGMNPSIYLMEKVVYPPSGPASDLITEVHYTEVTDKSYTHVQIRPDDVLIDVKDVF